MLSLTLTVPCAIPSTLTLYRLSAIKFVNIHCGLLLLILLTIILSLMSLPLLNVTVPIQSESDSTVTTICVEFVNNIYWSTSLVAHIRSLVVKLNVLFSISVTTIDRCRTIMINVWYTINAPNITAINMIHFNKCRISIFWFMVTIISSTPKLLGILCWGLSLIYKIPESLIFVNKNY